MVFFKALLILSGFGDCGITAIVTGASFFLVGDEQIGGLLSEIGTVLTDEPRIADD